MRSPFTLLAIPMMLGALACGGKGTANPAPDPQPAPSITRFVASSQTLAVGGSITLTAEYSHGSGTIEPGVGPVASGVPVVVTPVASLTYVLTVRGADGRNATASLPITVTPAEVVLGGSRFPGDKATLTHPLFPYDPKDTVLTVPFRAMEVGQACGGDFTWQFTPGEPVGGVPTITFTSTRVRTATAWHQSIAQDLDGNVHLLATTRGDAVQKVGVAVGAAPVLVMPAKPALNDTLHFELDSISRVAENDANRYGLDHGVLGSLSFWGGSLLVEQTYWAPGVGLRAWTKVDLMGTVTGWVRANP